MDQAHESACQYIFGKVSPRLICDDDVIAVCRIYIDIYAALKAKWKNPQLSAALADLTSAGQVYSDCQHVERRFITLRHIKHQIQYIKDILPFIV